ncbi:MAG TPA: alcohol dehydrogenase catalytic domain-containing protein [Candidatus Nitrosotalea sp.]|nr:alcohol dehydrogenase catalytic domain-containing protein [Candidatus Nitrosotalea sp.]
MKALTFVGPGELEVSDIAPPPPLAGHEALVRMTLAGVCGSDLHIYHGHTPVEPGTVLGHELVGVVEAVGAQVSRWRPGDRVVSSFVIACGTCAMCRRRWWAQCEERMILGHGAYFGGLGGAQAEFCVVPQADVNLFLIPPEVSDEQAVFAGDVLATGYFAARRGGIEPGDSVLVVGAGPVGMMALMAAGLLGAGRILIADPIEARLDLARSLGAETLNPELVNVEMAVRARTDEAGVDVVLECVGRPDAMETALRCVRGGGTVSAVGVPAQVSGEFPYYDAWNRDLTLRSGICNVHAVIDSVLRLLAAGRLHPELVVSHRLALEEGPEAYRIFDRRQAHKIMLRP